ncbi:MAG: PHP domain-containing protein [Saprospiraceae bacterium]|nr:PHP domain-containing protein [Saprospiraceae bacterium]MDW8230176.1 PHP domain-containing protein [Saprospiraceae bacterium]
MTNREIAQAFNELADLMELHEADDFRVRSYRNAYLTLRKVERPLSELTDAEIQSLRGIGPAITKKIRELLSTGRMRNLEEMRAQTPPGVVEMLHIGGFGPKKVRTVWQEMGIADVGELWYACNENRLAAAKGFGLKTQETLKNQLEYYLRSRDQLHYPTAEAAADFVGAWLTGRLPGAFVAPTGEVRRRCPVVTHVDVLVGYNGDLTPALSGEALTVERVEGSVYHVKLDGQMPLRLFHCRAEAFGSRWFETTGSAEFLQAFYDAFPALKNAQLRLEQEVFERAGLPVIPPELREGAAVVELARSGRLPDLITEADIRGIVHAHTTWSDGLHSLREMCLCARELGYAYIGITDHSQSAFYANGLKPDRVLAQMAEIDTLNAELAPFRILKGIESDILSDGTLDYEQALLEKFDFVIASVHSNLNMSIEKATQRIVKAIENPCTTILGHPTGRLLLSRTGYPLDWDAVFEACARHQVAIELNANPHRLDLDWSLIPRALAYGIRISINPDAHSKEGIHDLRYGVLAARKGGLSAKQCFNADEMMKTKGGLG